MNSLSIVQNYLNRISSANNETVRKEYFSNYLNQAFGKSEDARAIINDFAAGAERKVLNISKKHRGG
ncbi:hypothetical protein [Hymenobacter sp. BT491]|uniref:hypothetical protein n=1 Tax=Hymenobacter sp. BT491 TaxID=2766779 RepID=UPI00165395E8|nr:hypothetical protein [Hymenobacter sp. BT491]MBC6991197.1 hypothetical protein [Hymenobacter sp. BT491]